MITPYARLAHASYLDRSGGDSVTVHKFTHNFGATRMGSPATGLRCRQIEEADIDTIISLLTRGFPERDRRFWVGAFAQLTRHDRPPGLPKYGYLMESGAVAIGVLLLACSRISDGSAFATRCNLSSWYVDPAFRAYAPMLVSRAIRNKDVTYLNVSPAPQTRPIIEAQGFSCYSNGNFAALPMLKGLFSQSRAQVFEVDQRPNVKCDPHDKQILEAHAAYGCISLWCVADGRAYPFIFRPRLVRGVIPVARLIYCSDVNDFVRFAGPVGRTLARRGLLVVTLDANARVPGLPGWYRNGAPKYCKGPQRPRLGDLAYTECAMMDV